jgi:hypothetical protein
MKKTSLDRALKHITSRVEKEESVALGMHPC